MIKRFIEKNDGSVELIAMGLLAALIVVLAMPLFSVFESPDLRAPVVSQSK